MKHLKSLIITLSMLISLSVHSQEIKIYIFESYDTTKGVGFVYHPDCKGDRCWIIYADVNYDKKEETFSLINNKNCTFVHGEYDRNTIVNWYCTE